MCIVRYILNLNEHLLCGTLYIYISKGVIAWTRGNKRQIRIERFATAKEHREGVCSHVSGIPEIDAALVGALITAVL